METDVLIIGAGPAGLAAAYETALRGLNVTIVDELMTLGGQLNQQTQSITSLPTFFELMRGFELAEELVNRLDCLPVRYLLGHRVVGLYKDGSIGITDEKNVFPVKFRKVIVATGAAEKAVPFPKWTLPGVMTIGAAQTLVNRDFVKPGKNAVIVGSSDFAIEVALQLSEVGVNILGIVENRSTAIGKDLDKIRQLERLDIPFHFNAAIKEARGNGEIDEIDILQSGRVFTEKVDLVCIDGGRAPILDCFYQLGCAFGYQEALGGWIPQYNHCFRTSRDPVYLAGNAGGISSQGVLILTGSISGISVCETLKMIGNEEAQLKRDSLWKELKVLEKKLTPEVWEGRSSHIDNFSNPILADQFIS